MRSLPWCGLTPCSASLRDDPAGWDAYEERLRFELTTEERPATDEELFGLVRKEKAGRRTDEISLPAVVGKSAEMLRKEEETRWEDAFKAELAAEGRHSDELTTLPHSQAWKLTLARRMRDNHGAPASWIARRMGFNSEAYLRKLLAQS